MTSFTVGASTIKGAGPHKEESTLETEEDGGELERISKYNLL